VADIQISHDKIAAHNGDPGCHGNLRDFAKTAVEKPPALLTPSVEQRINSTPPAFQPAQQQAVLLPESFRGGCSFGASGTSIMSSAWSLPHAACSP